MPSVPRLSPVKHYQLFCVFKNRCFGPSSEAFSREYAPKQSPKKVLGTFLLFWSMFLELFVRWEPQKVRVHFFGRHGPLFRFLSKKIISRSVGRTLFGPKRWSHFGQKSEKKMHQIDTAVGTRGFMRDFLGARVRSSHLDEWNFSRPPKFQSPLIEKKSKKFRPARSWLICDRNLWDNNPTKKTKKSEPLGRPG